MQGKIFELGKSIKNLVREKIFEFEKKDRKFDSMGENFLI